MANRGRRAAWLPAALRTRPAPLRLPEAWAEARRDRGLCGALPLGIASRSKSWEDSDDGAGEDLMAMTAVKENSMTLTLSLLTELEGPEERRKFLALHPELVSAEVVEKLTEDARQLLQTDLDSALRKSDGALAIAEEIGDAESMARALRARANALRFKGQ